MTEKVTTVTTESDADPAAQAAVGAAAGAAAAAERVIERAEEAAEKKVQAAAELSSAQQAISEFEGRLKWLQDFVAGATKNLESLPGIKEAQAQLLKVAEALATRLEAVETKIEKQSRSLTPAAPQVETVTTVTPAATPAPSAPVAAPEAPNPKPKRFRIL